MSNRCIELDKADLKSYRSLSNCVLSPSKITSKWKTIFDRSFLADKYSSIFFVKKKKDKKTPNIILNCVHSIYKYIEQKKPGLSKHRYVLLNPFLSPLKRSSSAACLFVKYSGDKSSNLTLLHTKRKLRLFLTTGNNCNTFSAEN